MRSPKSLIDIGQRPTLAAARHHQWCTSRGALSDRNVSMVTCPMLPRHPPQHPISSGIDHPKRHNRIEVCEQLTRPSRPSATTFTRNGDEKARMQETKEAENDTERISRHDDKTRSQHSPANLLQNREQRSERQHIWETEDTR